MSDFISPEREIESPNYERITEDPKFDGFARDRHEYRYKVAGSYVKPNEVVIDAACGTGYGAKFLNTKNYIGLDKNVVPNPDLVQVSVDLNTWTPPQSFDDCFEFDVFVSIETIEHLENYKHLLEVGRHAKRLMIVSTPIIPTKDKNEFHVNDFTKEQLDKELQVDGWKIFHYEEQDSQYGIWILTK